MPITLEKLFSATREATFTFMEETVTVTWSPARWNGEMQELAEQWTDQTDAERDGIDEVRKARETDIAELAALETSDQPDLERITALQAKLVASEEVITRREFKLQGLERTKLHNMLAALLVSWDVLGADGKPIGTDLGTMNTLPDGFLGVVFMSLAQENQPDPSQAPKSDESSPTERTSASSPTGTPSSPRPVRSVSPRSSSTNGRTRRDAIPSGASGR